MTQISSSASALGHAASHPLVARLTALRGRVRAMIVLSGTGIAVTAAVGALFLLMLVDYLIHIPTGLRVVLLLAWIVAVGVIVWRRLFAPLSTRLTDQFLASRVEIINKQLSDDLMSAVHFIHTRAAATNALAARHIDSVAERTAAIPFEEAVDFRAAGKALGFALLAVVIVGTVGLLNPALANIALHRWLTPNSMPWPHNTHVAFDWSQFGGQKPEVLPMGEKITFRAKVDQGGVPRVWLYNWLDNNSHTVSLLMTHQKEQSSAAVNYFESALEPEGNGLNLRLVAGDDSEQPAIHIALRPRPVITELFGSITPPAYVKNPKDPSQPAPAVVVDLLSQTGRAVEGAAVSLRIRSTKAFLVNANHEPELHLFDQNKDEELSLAMNRRLLEPNVAEVNFKAAHTLQARVMMRDIDNFENRIGGTVTLEVVPDALPTISMTEPRGSVERVPNGVVEIAVEASDDWGLDGLKLRAEKFDAKTGDAPVVDLPLMWLNRSTDSAVGSTKGTAKFTWDLASLNLAAGARLTFYAMVQDNYEVDGQRHDWVKSAPLTLQIKSANEITEAARNNLKEISDRINALKLQQEATRMKTEAIRKTVEASGNATLQQKAELAEFAQQENQQASTANSIQQRTEAVADDLRQNKMGEGELGKLAQDVAAGMQSVGQDNMPKAASDLNRAQENAGSTPPNGQPTPQSKAAAQQSTAAMASAGKQQDAAVDTMDNLIKQLASASDFSAIKTKVAGLLEKQTQIKEETKKAGDPLAGKNAGDLTKDQRDKLDELARRQNELKDQTADTLNQMNKTQQELAQTDPSSAESLKSAADAGTKADITGSQGKASGSIGSNKTGDANKDQGQAQAGLQQMLDELEKNDRRKLEQLARELRALLDEAKKIRADEDVLNKDTVAAGASAASGSVQKLGDRQGTLQMNTIVLQKKVENTQKARPAAPDVKAASDAMSDAAAALDASKQPPSLEPETKAIAALDEAIKKLTEETAKADEAVKDKDLAQFIKDYEAIQKDQQTVKSTTDQIETRRLAAVDKEVNRLDGQKLVELSKTQGGLIERLMALSTDPKLKEFDVVVWMNGQVSELMTTSKDRLSKQQLGPQIASVQQGSIDRLQLIIDALKEEKKNNDDFEKPGGGGGGGGGGKPPLVPPVAQLKLLKGMQTIVNGETTSMNKSLSTAVSDADKNLFQMQTEKLGGKQGEIRGMADKLIQNLTGGGGGPAPGRGGAPGPVKKDAQ